MEQVNRFVPSRPTGELARMVDEKGVAVVIEDLMGLVKFIDAGNSTPWVTVEYLLESARQKSSQIEEVERQRLESVGVT